MFVRKGTTRWKKQSTKPPTRRPSLPAQNSTSDPEIGESTSVAEQTGPSMSTTASSIHTLTEDKNLVNKSHRFEKHDSYQAVNYGSIFVQLRQAQIECCTVFEFLQRLWEIVWQSSIMMITLLLLFGLPISMLAMGTSYLEDCPKEPKIPIYLLVGGAFGFIHIIMLLWQQKRSRVYTPLDESKDEPDIDDSNMIMRSNRFTTYVLSFFLLFWFALGNYWLFSIWQPNYAQPLHEPRNWCSHRLYSYTFYQLVVCYTLLGLGCLVLITCLLTYLYGAWKDKDLLTN